MMSISYDLERAKNLIQNVIKELEEAPEKKAIIELINACEAIDRYYKERYCAELDLDYNEPDGTTYEEGICLEFYIEAEWWHDVSKALRKLRTPEDEKS